MRKGQLESYKSLKELPARPLVSIVMPSYNQAAFIRASIDSILSQKYRPLELIVVDGASVDGTLPILESLIHVSELRWISEPDSGVVQAVNKGLNLASGDIVAIQSSDDMYYDNEVVGDAVQQIKAKDTALVYGNIVKRTDTGQFLNQSCFDCFSLENFLLMKTRIPQESSFFRREVLLDVGGWRGEVSFAADTDFFLRIALKYKVKRVKKLYGLRVMHEGQRYEQKRKIVNDYAKMIDLNIGPGEYDERFHTLAEISKLLIQSHYLPGERKLDQLKNSWKVSTLSSRAGVQSPVSTLHHFKIYWLMIRAKNLIRKIFWPAQNKSGF